MKIPPFQRVKVGPQPEAENTNAGLAVSSFIGEFFKTPGYLESLGIAGPLFTQDQEGTWNINRECWQALVAFEGGNQADVGEPRPEWAARGWFESTSAYNYAWFRAVGLDGRQIGRTLYRHLDADNQFWTFAGIMIKVITGGVSAAADAATVADSAATAAESASIAGSGTMDFDLDFADVGADDAISAADYSDFLDPSDFSSGESIQAFSDAQNVDYGFEVEPDAGGAFPSVDDVAGQTPQTFDPAQYGDTPEPVGDFGSQDYGQLAKDEVTRLAKQKVIGAAIKPAAGRSAPAGSFTTVAKNATAVTRDAVGGLADVMRIFSGNSTSQQKENIGAVAPGRGQLRETQKPGAGGTFPVGLALAGAGVAVLGFLALRRAAS